MTEKGTGENAGAVVSGHEMVVTYEPSMRGFVTEPVCHEPAGADCRLACTQGCEEWGTLDRHATWRDRHGSLVNWNRSR